MAQQKLPYKDVLDIIKRAQQSKNQPEHYHIPMRFQKDMKLEAAYLEGFKTGHKLALDEIKEVHITKDDKVYKRSTTDELHIKGIDTQVHIVDVKEPIIGPHGIELPEEE
jgi:hypothetical protein